MKKLISKKFGVYGLLAVLMSSGLATEINAAPVIDAPATPVPTRTLVNPSFEYPAFADSGATWISLDGYIPGNETTLQGWFSTHPTSGYHIEETNAWRFKDALGNPFQHLVELWVNNNNNIPAPQGNQFAELNAQANSALYQDILVFDGETIPWAASHRGRMKNDVADTAEVFVSDPNDWTGVTFSGNKLYSANIATSKDGSVSAITPNSGSVAGSHTKTALSNGWAKYGDVWSGPTESKKYRFAFQAVSSGNGTDEASLAMGNLLDDIQIKLSPIVDFADPKIDEIYPLGNSIYYLPIRINGQSQSVATVEIDVALAGADYQDYTLEALASGTNGAVANGVSATKLANGNIQVTVPANLYDPNNPAHYITVPINFAGAFAIQDKVAQFSIIDVNGGGGAGVQDLLIPPADSSVYGFTVAQETTVKGGFPD